MTNSEYQLSMYVDNGPRLWMCVDNGEHLITVWMYVDNGEHLFAVADVRG